MILRVSAVGRCGAVEQRRVVEAFDVELGSVLKDRQNMMNPFHVSVAMWKQQSSWSRVPPSESTGGHVSVVMHRFPYWIEIFRRNTKEIRQTVRQEEYQPVPVCGVQPTFWVWLEWGLGEGWGLEGTGAGGGMWKKWGSPVCIHTCLPGMECTVRPAGSETRVCKNQQRTE